MIDDVRKTVLTALNKENRGYLTPEQFNLYAKQAQMEVFNLYFSEQAKLVAMKNARRLSSEYGDRLRGINEKIELFVKLQSVTSSGSGHYTIPSDVYQAMSLRYNNKIVEKISPSRELLLNNSNMTAPSLLYPSYVERSGSYILNPYNDDIDLDVVYVRTPKAPKWTWVDLSSSGSEEPVFNPSASLGFQDFELPAEDAPILVLEILKLAGLTIRDGEAIQAAVGFESSNFQKENS